VTPLNIDDGGKGESLPVLFVHGDSGNLTQWRAQLDHLRRSRRAVAFDLRGMGKSPPDANGDYSVAAMTSDVDAVAGALRLQRFVLVGHSYGATVAAAYAAQHPERVAGLLLADGGGNVKVSKEEEKAFFAELRKDKDAFLRQFFAPILEPSREEVRNAVFESVRNTPVEVFARAMAGLLTVDVGSFVRAYHGPLLLIAAADIESPASLHVQFPELPAKKMRGVGHWLMMDKPDEFNALLDGFLKSIG